MARPRKPEAERRSRPPEDAGGSRSGPFTVSVPRSGSISIALTSPRPPASLRDGKGQFDLSDRAGEAEIMLHHDSQILKYVADRGITRLVHFTRLEYAKAIIRQGGILSRRRLRSKRLHIRPNDRRRLDGFLDYICCSVEYPNVYVLADYVQKYPGTEWVLLFLHTDLLGRWSTAFSPVNAAKERGRYIQEGIFGLSSLFDDRVPGERSICRAPSHRRNCPTDVQAEVLVKGSIPLSRVREIAVRSAVVGHEIKPLLRSVRCQVPVMTTPRFFDKHWVWRTIRGEWK